MKCLLSSKYNIKTLFVSTEARYILKHSQFLMVFIIIIISFLIWHGLSLVSTHAERTLTIIADGYGELVDKDYYCKSINCKYIYQGSDELDPGTLFDIDTNDITLTDDPPYYILEGFEIYIPIRSGSDIYYVNTDGYLYKLLIFIVIVYLTLIMFMLNMIRGILAIERDECLASLHNKESDLQHNILFNITANINHEVNSPLLVIKSVIDEIHLELKDLDKTIDECAGRRKCEPLDLFRENMDELMDLANESVESIESVIRPLSDYKNIKFTNGDRSTYMLIDTAMKMLRRTNISTFDNITIDKEFNKYSIAHDNGMSNGFFLNLMINHVKNSLEANASKISVVLHKRNMTHLYIHITDNGSGVSKEMIDSIYEANVTTKASIEEYRRGVGLYLSKLLINRKYDGDDTFISSEPGVATTFCIKVRYEKFKFYKRDNHEENTI